MVEESGFAKANITMVDKVLVVTKEDDIAGLTMLMSGPFVAHFHLTWIARRA